jgi:isopentenyldiphosphate isomerase
MEMVDIVDDNDNVIGKASRDEVYEKLLTHRIVHVIVFDKENKMALQPRGINVSFCPGHWSTSAGGHVRSGETYEDAATREYAEELGVKSRLEFFSKDLYKVAGRPNKILVTFKTTFGGPFDIDLDVVEKIEYFALDEIRNMIRKGEKFHPELLFLLENHIL